MQIQRLDPETPGYFRCEKLRATLEKVKCGTRWKYAKGLDAKKSLNQTESSYMVCRGCPVGQGHAKLVRLKRKKRITTPAGYPQRNVMSDIIDNAIKSRRKKS